MTDIVHGPVENTDRELWRQTPGDYYAPSLHVTADGKIGINVGGTVLIADVEIWHGLHMRATLKYRIDMASNDQLLAQLQTFDPTTPQPAEMPG